MSAWSSVLGNIWREEGSGRREGEREREGGKREGRGRREGGEREGREEGRKREGEGREREKREDIFKCSTRVISQNPHTKPKPQKITTSSFLAR